MTHLRRRIRFRGTPRLGWLWRRVVHNGECLYHVWWEGDDRMDPRPYPRTDLESITREERLDQGVPARVWARDRKDAWDHYETVDERERYRVSDFERV